MGFCRLFPSYSTMSVISFFVTWPLQILNIPPSIPVRIASGILLLNGRPVKNLLCLLSLIRRSICLVKGKHDACFNIKPAIASNLYLANRV